MLKSFQWALIGALVLCGVLPLLAAPVAVLPEAPAVLAFQQAGMAPVRPLAEIGGATISAKGALVTVTRDGHTFAFTADSTAALQDGKKITLPLAPFTNSGITYVPVRALVTALGGTMTPATDPHHVQVTFPKSQPIELALQDQPGTPQQLERGASDLYLIPTDGTPLRQLVYDMTTPTLMGRRFAHLTANGAEILYTKGMDIYRRAVSAPTGTNLTAAYSKDGIMSGNITPCADGSIVFMQFNPKSAEEKPFPDLCRMNADGSGFKRLAKGAFPQVSADGSLIAYMAMDQDKNPTVHVMKVDGSNDRALATGMLSAISPDGSKISYLKAKKTEQGLAPDGLSVMTVSDGKVIEPAVDDQKAPVAVNGPYSSFSPDGKSLAVMQMMQGIWTMDAGYANRKQLSNGNDQWPLYSPDGKQIAFVREGHLLLMNTDGSGVKPLAPGMIIMGFFFTPDGSQIIADGFPEPVMPPQQAIKPMPAPKPTVKAKPGKYAAPTAAEIAAVKKAGTRQATIKTAKGLIVVELYGKDAPLTTANFIKLVNAKFYNGLLFHRVVKDFVIQGGDPNGDGSGGPGYAIKLETSPKLRHGLGTLAMARAQDPDSAGSQFYITLADNESVRNLDNPQNPYAVFGKVIKGMDVVKKIAQGDKIISITVK